MYYISMTRTLAAAVDDPQVAEDLHDPSARFVFACKVEHVLSEDLSAPYELTWGTGDLVHAGRIHSDQVDEELWATWMKFRTAIEAAHRDERVWWGLGRMYGEVNPLLPGYHPNYPSVVDALEAAGKQFFYR